MRLGYSCHDSFPSSDTNTQQIFWTVFEVTRTGVAVDLVIPSIARAPASGDDRGAASGPADAMAGARGEDAMAAAREAVSRHYGVDPRDMSDAFRLVPAGANAAHGPIAKARFDLGVARHLAAGGCDTAWTRDPLAAVSCARRGVPFVFETYRPDFAASPRFAPWRRVCLRQAACRGIITHSRLAAAAFVEAGVPADRVLVAHNGYSPALMEPRLSREDARARLALPGDRPLVVYAGHVGPEKGIDALLRAVARVPEATLLVLGVDERSGEGRWLADAARDAGASNLIVRPRVRVADVAPYLYAADCLAIPPTDAPRQRFARTVLPMKIFTYLAAGRAILAARTPDVSEVLDDGVSALLVPPDEPDAAGEALRRIVGDGALRARLAAGAETASREYTWAARARKLVGWFERVAAPAGVYEDRRSRAAAAASSRS
jgi:glycosyltransferase involved in cell wall biosynthesis